MDCIILAGNRENYQRVDVENNKGFLTIGDRTILEIILGELSSVDQIKRVCLVGPSVRIKQLVESKLQDYPKPLFFEDQRTDLVSNVQAGLSKLGIANDPHAQVLLLPSDIPLILGEEVSQFLRGCEQIEADWITGMSPEQALHKFYPDKNEPGITMAYFHLAQGRFRINNMHYTRPVAITQLEVFRRIYALRYQKKFINILQMAFQLLMLMGRSPSAVFFWAGMQLASVVRKWGAHGLARFLQKPLHIPFAERVISNILKARFRVVITHFGGAALDVDNDQDYRTARLRFQDWTAAQRNAPPPDQPFPWRLS